MSPKVVAPNIKLRSFSCPHCGALASQRWYRLYAKPTRQGQPPDISSQELLERLVSAKADAADAKSQKTIEKIMDRVQSGLTGELHLVAVDDPFCQIELINAHISCCFACDKLTLWKHAAIVDPPIRYEIEPNSDLNEDIRADFNEARTILDLSPRGAAALLRLCIQKLCKQLDLPGKDINADIVTLVTNGLGEEIQKALDVVRVIGNEAVHPGTMDLKDDRATAAKLFELVNFIAYDRITRPKDIAQLFDGLPENKKKGIEDRDRRSE